MDVVLIPAYEPDEKLIGLVQQLTENNLSILVVDDGSGEKFAHIFEAVRPYATVLTQKRNGGKGAALKVGMRYLWEQMPECKYVITCDADGQHAVKDVVRVCKELHEGNGFVLSVRQKQPNVEVPLRSKVGNSLSRIVYTLLTNRFLPDNQSGLRGFKRAHIEWMLKVEKNNYDYEMNVLYYAAKKGLRITTLPIETIYIDDNASSHFNPIKDTVRIYKSLFWLARATFIAWIASELAVVAASLLSGNLDSNVILLTLPLTGLGSLIVLTAIELLLSLKGKGYSNHWANIIYTITTYIFYTVGCLLLWRIWGQCPLWLSFNIWLLVALPVRYWVAKCWYLLTNRAEHT